MFGPSRLTKNSILAEAVSATLPYEKSLLTRTYPCCYPCCRRASNCPVYKPSMNFGLSAKKKQRIAGRRYIKTASAARRKSWPAASNVTMCSGVAFLQILPHQNPTTGASCHVSYVGYAVKVWFS